MHHFSPTSNDFDFCVLHLVRILCTTLKGTAATAAAVGTVDPPSAILAIQDHHYLAAVVLFIIGSRTMLLLLTEFPDS